LSSAHDGSSYEIARDMTPETFLRAWGKRESFQGRASLRTWLYRIATNACLDFLEKRQDRTPVSTELQGAGLAQRCCTCSRGPTASQMTHTSRRWLARETIELAFIVAVQHLPAAASGGPDPPRRARLAGADRRHPGTHAGVGEQCPAASPCHNAQASARRPARLARQGRARAERG
jgi:hypothetical protein